MGMNRFAYVFIETGKIASSLESTRIRCNKKLQSFTSEASKVVEVTMIQPLSTH